MSRKLIYAILFVVALGAMAVQAQDMEWIRAAYWDGRYGTAWGGGGETTRDALQAAGYEILDADQLKTWMDARIADKELSVVVFCRDVVPDTVVESQSASCTLRKYLNAGGKIVWYADIPFYYWGHVDGNSDTWGDAGAPAVLGFDTASAPRDSGQTATLTPAGIKWGLTQTWTSQRPLSPSVTTNVTILATDASGNAAAWAKHYVTNDNFRGFVRFRDTGGQANVEDIMRVAEYISLKASNPSPADGATGVTLPLFTWEAGSFGQWHDLYLGTSPELTEADLIEPRLYPKMHYYVAGFTPGTTYYWRVDEIAADETVVTGDVWTFTAAPLTAFNPNPRDGDKWIDPNADLSWTPGQGAIEHQLYFGTDENAVANRDASVFKVKQMTLTYDPGTLEADTTYYWAVDEPGQPGEVWHFTTAGGGGGIKGEYFNNMDVMGEPALTRLDPSVDFNWGDPGGPGEPIGIDLFSARWTADLEIAVADTYTFITSTDDGARLWLDDEQIINQWVDQGTTDASSAPIYLEPGVYSLRMEYYENGGGAVARLSWETPSVARQIIPAGPLQPPLRAKAVYPKNGDVDIAQDLVLTWSAGEKAATHDVFFGDDADAVAAADTGSPEYQGGQTETTLALSDLEWGKAYYWRIDEINTLEADSPWKGSVWSFTTADFIVVDNFEGYSDDFENADAIWEVWIDGLTNLTGSIIGYFDAPFAERTVVHSGNQSMPFDFNNIVSPYYSEGELPLDPTQDWTVEGVSDLSLWVRGYPAPAAVDVTETGGKITLTGAGTDIWGNSDEFTYAYKTLNGNGSIVARVVSIGPGTNTWAKGGVMIRDSLDGGSTHAMMVMTDNSDGTAGNGASFQHRLVADGASTNEDSATLVAPPYWVKIERLGDGLTGYMSLDGNNWTLQGSTQFITMSAPVYIGLCVTSHVTGEDRTYEFDNIQTSGSVSGAWQGAIISAPRHNAAQSLYVVVADSSGKSAMVTNPDIVNINAWTEWKIPLSSFGGVNLGRVGTLFIGVGDPDNPTPDGAGLIFVDDIRVMKPAAE